MYRKTLAFSAVIALSVPISNVGAVAVGGQSVNIEVDIHANKAPIEVIMIEDGILTINSIRPDDSGIYATKITLSDHWPTKLTLVASWKDGNEQVYLRLTSAHSGKPIIVRIYHTNMPLTLGAINRLRSRGSDILSATQTYFDARSIYRRQLKLNWQHTVASRAARIWFDASFELVKPRNSPFRMDPDAIEANKRYEDKSAVDPEFRKSYRAITKPGYIKGMIAQIQALEWRDVGLVPGFIEKKDFKSAAIVNNYFLNLHGQLDSKEKKNVVRYHGVTLGLLKENQDYIQKITGRYQATGTY